METSAVGVFSSRERAEEAVRELLQRKVPEESIVFLTPSETEATTVGTEAKTVGKELGATVGGFMGAATGMSAGVLAATLLVPGLGPVFALGFGAAALLGLVGAGAGSAVGEAAVNDGDSPQPSPNQKPEDAVFFRELLKERRTVVVVRTESQETANVAREILDRLGLGIQGRTPVKSGPAK